MEIDSLFWAALQSSFILGLIHGVNPCGHSWLVLTPFVLGQKKSGYVALLTLSFVGGTGLACILLGATLGTVSSLLPTSASFWVEIFTSAILLVLGILLLYKPHLLHSHSHEHPHNHCSSHEADTSHRKQNHSHKEKVSTLTGKWLAPSLFGIGFVNMIIPCPTAAVMYGYALNSGSPFEAMFVFGSYALSTAISVGAVIAIIYKVTSFAGKMQKDWLEPMIMRLAGVIIIIFSYYGLYAALARSG